MRSFFLSGFCISFGSLEPLDILALFERANPGPLSRSQTGCASLPPLPAVLRLEYGVYVPRGLEGDQTVSSHQFEEVSAGRLKSPPIYCKILIAHVKGRSTARISSMTSSQTDSQSGCEGRDGEPGSAFCLECDWTMNSWVFGRIRISLVSKVSLSLSLLCLLRSRRTQDWGVGSPSMIFNS